MKREVALAIVIDSEVLSILLERCPCLCAVHRQYGWVYGHYQLCTHPRRLFQNDNGTGSCTRFLELVDLTAYLPLAYLVPRCSVGLPFQARMLPARLVLSPLPPRSLADTHPPYTGWSGYQSAVIL
ncbi:unnamed protein product, partial [Discosporangium mesarthrocarpum]